MDIVRKTKYVNVATLPPYIFPERGVDKVRGKGVTCDTWGAARKKQFTKKEIRLPSKRLAHTNSQCYIR